MDQPPQSMEFLLDTISEEIFFLLLSSFFALSAQCYVMTVAGNLECLKVTIFFLIVPQAIIRKFGLFDLKFLY